METVWYALHTKRHSEARVDGYLRQQGYGTLMPLIEVIRHFRPRRSALLEPLFPGYLFVQMASATMHPADWHTVRWTPGVRSVLATDDGPAPVSGEVIETIQERIRDLGFVRPSPAYRPGQHVRIQRGPFAGLGAVFDCPISREGRVRVLLELLGQPRGVELDLVDLESA